MAAFDHLHITPFQWSFFHTSHFHSLASKSLSNVRFGGCQWAIHGVRIDWRWLRVLKRWGFSALHKHQSATSPLPMAPKQPTNGCLWSKRCG